MLVKPLVRSIVRSIAGKPTASLGSGFSPTSLFADGSKGVVYDNNDFVDSATWRRNLYTYTEQLQNAAWYEASAGTFTVATNSSTDPLGGSTADVLTTSASGLVYVAQNVTCNVDTYTATFRVKLISGSGQASGIIAGTSGSSITLTSDWQTVTVTAAIGSAGVKQTGLVLPNSAQVAVWGAQIERASAASDYQRITDFNSDFLAAFPGTTLFLDSAGTTPATVNGLVGLQLDKSANLALGAELVSAIDFQNASLWSAVSVTPTSASSFTNSSGGGGGMFTVSSPFVVGKVYEISVTYSKTDAITTIGVYAQSGTFPLVTSTAASGTLTYRGIALATGQAYIRVSGNTTVTVSSATIKEIQGNHRYQTTTGSKPVLRGTPIGANLVTNGDFASGTGWTAPIAGASISSGTLNFDGVTSLTNGAIVTTNTPTTAIVSGNVYRVTYTINGGTAAAVSVNLGGVLGTARIAAGTYVEYITATSTAAPAIMARGSTGIRTGSIDNVEVVDVSAGSVTAPYGLQYDGVDDFLQTAAVDFTATDKMFVCAGVRKLSDAARGILVELGNAITQSFVIQAPSGAFTNIAYTSTGSIGVNAIDSAIVAPATRVISGISDIAGDSCLLRSNGVQTASSASDQGTGNYANAILYFGRRAGTSIPFNGLDFGFVICGKTLTSTQISSTERYIAQRTGVTI